MMIPRTRYIRNTVPAEQKPLTEYWIGGFSENQAGMGNAQIDYQSTPWKQVHAFQWQEALGKLHTAELLNDSNQQNTLWMIQPRGRPFASLAPSVGQRQNVDLGKLDKETP